MGDPRDEHDRPQPGHRAGPHTLRTLALALLCPALGAAAGVALTILLVIPTIGVGGVQRLVDLPAHADSLDQPPDAVFLGSSVVVEGVDAAAVAERLPHGASAQNWAINGCGVTEVISIVPRLLDPPPRAVVLSLVIGDLGDPSDVDADKAYAYALAGVADAWPEHWTADDLPGLSPKTVTHYRASDLAAAVHFRAVPLNYVEQRLRRLARTELRTVPPDQRWTSPYELGGSISGWRLDRHVQSLARSLELRANEGPAGPGAQAIERLVHEITSRGPHVLLAVAPHHPRIAADFPQALDHLRQLADTLAQHERVHWLDAASLVPADGFADALHLNAAGRSAFSQRLAQALAPILAGGP